GVTTSTEEKLEVPDGIWFKCPSCKSSILTKDLHENLSVCPKCDYHHRLGSEGYFRILFDEGSYQELDANLVSLNPLNFVDTKDYAARLKDAKAKTGLKDALRSAHGKLEGHDLVVACMDFEFIGGSMGTVMGEKIARAIDKARALKCPVLVISRSGGARMMEAAYSLMQMAKTSAKLALADQEGVPYFSLMTDPTTGGVTASFAMLGDFNLAEPGALIGFAGPRVIIETIKKELPEGFQSAESVLESGFLDLIVPRHKLRETLARLMDLLRH
ncbi:MAG: acetyl-CoA carboxylase carboxyltransferase subunit beta, partial [Sphingobacteriia bacterium]|nr:acetyl-CoA carboxylase carboxyltransferase subunit beta [Sphingobacteriia bacterium]